MELIERLLDTTHPASLYVVSLDITPDSRRGGLSATPLRNPTNALLC
jgi:hypothetical protein